MDLTTLPLARQKKESSAYSQYIPDPARVNLHLCPMAMLNVFLGSQLVAAAAIIHDDDFSRLAGWGLVGILAGSALGMIRATSRTNTASWRIWARRFSAYFLSGLICGAVLIVIAAQFGLQPNNFMAFACGGLGGCFGLSMILYGEKKAPRVADKLVDNWTDDDEEDDEPLKPLPPSSKTVRLVAPTRKLE